MTTTKKYSLPREFAEKWVKALRSGEYKQGRGLLHSNFGYCCLGVAGFICGATNEMLKYAGGYLHTEPIYFNQDVIKNIPVELHGTRSRNELIYELTVMNDGGTDFPHIADWIEQNVAFV